MNKARIESYPTIKAKDLKQLFEGSASPHISITSTSKGKPFIIQPKYNKDTGLLEFYSEDKQHETKFYIIQKDSNLGKGVRYYFSLDKAGKFKTDKLYLIELTFPQLNDKKILGLHSHFQFKHYYAIQKQSHNNRRFDILHKYEKKAEDILYRKYAKRKYAGKQTRTFKKALRYQEKASDSEFKLMVHFQRRFGHLL